MKRIVQLSEEMDLIVDSRFKSWTKTVTAVDRSKTNGYAFEGQFLRMDGVAELEIGSYVLCYHEEGSRANHDPEIDVFEVTPDGLKKVFHKVCGSTWALEVRDQIADLIEGKAEIELSAEEQELVNRLKALAPERLQAVLSAIK